MTAKVVSVPGSLWELVVPGTHRPCYLDEAGRWHTITIGDDHRIVRRDPCRPYSGELVGPGVFKEWFLDGGGFNLLVAIDHHHRALERVRVFHREEEDRLANYLRVTYNLNRDPRNIARRCVLCRGWFFSRRARQVRCRRCIDTRRRRDGDR